MYSTTNPLQKSETEYMKYLGTAFQTLFKIRTSKVATSISANQHDNYNSVRSSYISFQIND